MKVTDYSRHTLGVILGTSTNSLGVGGVTIDTTISGASNTVIIATSSNTAQWDTGSGHFRLDYNGGVEGFGSLGNLGSTKTVSLATGNYQQGTLNANCTITLSGWTPGAFCDLGIRLVEDGTGGWTPTFTGVTWVGGTTPTHTTTANSVTDYVFWSTDGGVTVYGGQIGAGGSTTTVTTGADSDDHVHVVSEPITADGTSSTYYLANYPEDDTVAAYINGIRTDVTQTLDAITFSGTPPVLAALRFDYLVELT